MDRKIVPFKRWHHDWLGESAEPGGFIKLSEMVRAQLETENSWTAVVDGRVIGCAGTVQQWPGRHVAWAVFAPDAGEHMLWITRSAIEHLAKVKGRIELTVRTDFPIGMKWARLLGFRVETPVLERFGPAGEDHIGYVRIN